MNACMPPCVKKSEKSHEHRGTQAIEHNRSYKTSKPGRTIMNINILLGRSTNKGVRDRHQRVKIRLLTFRCNATCTWLQMAWNTHTYTTCCVKCRTLWRQGEGTMSDWIELSTDIASRPQPGYEVVLGRKEQAEDGFFFCFSPSLTHHSTSNEPYTTNVCVLPKKGHRTHKHIQTYRLRRVVSLTSYSLFDFTSPTLV